MKLENYVLNIYCDNKDVHNTGGLIFDTHYRVYGYNAGECRRKVRKLGWRLGQKKKTDLCPACHETLKKARIESRIKKMQADMVGDLVKQLEERQLKDD